MTEGKWSMKEIIRSFLIVFFSLIPFKILFDDNAFVPVIVIQCNFCKWGWWYENYEAPLLIGKERATHFSRVEEGTKNPSLEILSFS